MQYKQIVDQARRLIASGQIASGADLPSVRELAESLEINPMTVSKAYQLLESEKLVERRRGVGMTVIAKPHSNRARIDLLRPALEHVAQEARQLEVDPDQVMTLFAELLQRKS